MSDDDLRLRGVAGTRYRVVVLAIVVLLALLLAAKWAFLPASYGEPEAPRRVLVVGAVKEDLAGWLDHRGFEATSASWFDAEAHGEEDGREGLAAVLHYADMRGFAFVALDLSTAPAWVDLGSVRSHGDAVADGEGRRMAVFSAGDYARAWGVLSSYRATNHELRFGTEVEGLRLDEQLAGRYGLITGLFRQTVLDEMRNGRRTPSNEFLLALEREKTEEYIEEVEEHLSYLEGVRASWTAAVEGLDTVSQPFESTRVEPLADGTLLIVGREGRVRSSKVDHATVKPDLPRVAAILPGTDERVHCAEVDGEALGEAWDEVRVSRDGRAVASWQAGRVVVFEVGADPEAPCHLRRAAVYDVPHLSEVVERTLFGEPGPDGRGLFADGFGFGLWDKGTLKKRRLPSVNIGPASSQVLRWREGGLFVARGEIVGTREEALVREAAVVFVDPATGQVLPFTTRWLQLEADPEADQPLRVLQVHVGEEPNTFLAIVQRDGTDELSVTRVKVDGDIAAMVAEQRAEPPTAEALCLAAADAPVGPPTAGIVSDLDPDPEPLDAETCKVLLDDRKDKDPQLARRWIASCLESLHTIDPLAGSAEACVTARRTASRMASEVPWGDLEAHEQYLGKFTVTESLPLPIDAEVLPGDLLVSDDLSRIAWMPPSGAAVDRRGAPRVLEVGSSQAPDPIGTEGGQLLRLAQDRLWLVQQVQAPPNSGAQYAVPVAASRPLPPAPAP